MTLDSLDAILVRVAREHGVRPMRLITGGRCQPLQQVKRQVMYEMREAGGSLPKIARVLGYRHHQPVIHGLRVYAAEQRKLLTPNEPEA
jgi:chromosomal replication initiation ATPase DnaA